MATSVKHSGWKKTAGQSYISAHNLGIEALRLTKSATGCDVRLLGDTPATNYLNYDASDGSLDFVGNTYANFAGFTGTAALSFAAGFTKNILTVGATANVVGSGAIIADDDSMIEVYCDDNSAGGAAATTLNIMKVRALLVDGAFQGEQYIGLFYQKYINAALSSYSAGVMGVIQWATAIAVTGYHGGTAGRVGSGTGTFVINDYLFGVAAQINVASNHTGSGKSVGYLIQHLSVANWDVGIYALDNSCDTGIYIGSCATSISLGGTVTSRAISSLVTMAAPNLTDGYGAHEFDLTTTGTVAGHAACLSAWVNVPSGIGGTGNSFLCAQTNGIYEDAAASLANTKVVAGMRAQAILGDTNYQTLHFFSLASIQPVTAWFDISTFHNDVGMVAAAGQTTAPSTCLRFVSDVGKNVKYIRLYDDVN